MNRLSIFEQVARRFETYASDNEALLQRRTYPRGQLVEMASAVKVWRDAANELREIAKNPKHRAEVALDTANLPLGETVLTYLFGEVDPPALMGVRYALPGTFAERQEHMANIDKLVFTEGKRPKRDLIKDIDAMTSTAGFTLVVLDSLTAAEEHRQAVAKAEEIRDWLRDD